MDELNDLERELFKDIEEMDIPKGDHFKKDTDTYTDTDNDPVVKKPYVPYNKGKFNNPSNKNKGIDLFKENPEPSPVVFSDLKVTKSFVLALASATMTLSDEEKDVLIKVLKVLKAKGYKIRLLCNTVTLIWDDIKNIFDRDDIIISKPWDKYCPIEEYTHFTPTDKHKRAAAMHFKNFDNLPTAIKFINSAILGTIFGKYLDEVVEFILVYDPFILEDNKIDFKQAKDSAVFRWFPISIRKEYSISVYNLAVKKEIKDFSDMLKVPVKDA